MTKTILITGATDGLGRGLAEALAREGHRVLAHGRDTARLDRVGVELGIPAGDRLRADLAELDQVRALAADTRAATDRLDVLVVNAGIGGGEPDGRDRRVSADGHELRFAVNHLAGFLLTLELLPLLRASSPARVVLVSSLGQRALDFDNLMLERGYDGSRAYCQSKLAQIMFGISLAERVPAAEVTVNSLHPATYMPTKMVLLERGSHLEELSVGVNAVRRLAVDPDVADTSGAFFDRLAESTADSQAYDREARELLWRRSLELTGAPGL
ncbi:SDR family NAD(P)-dependent oxidoreductase [Actinokineospora enzanensis]|uniref:SDR family NAD(P)-dependent oxidoreductase n=1 Tax=Actinokineospora enzanensis TaxID=155975 RepID=UPI0003802BE9|nr:SDR family NAD(P)-dependent oxidoreductase [Actinokineospora enzanensis]